MAPKQPTWPERLRGLLERIADALGGDHGAPTPVPVPVPVRRPPPRHR